LTDSNWLQNRFVNTDEDNIFQTPVDYLTSLNNPNSICSNPKHQVLAYCRI
jgi:hypothetical protein